MAKVYNKLEREKLVMAMEYIARQVNDEAVFEDWLVAGVGDGDIRYGALDPNVNGGAEWYAEDDDVFADLMGVFLAVMHEAYLSGGLYCDDVVSK